MSKREAAGAVLAFGFIAAVLVLVVLQITGCAHRPAPTRVNPGKVAMCRFDWQPGCDEYLKDATSTKNATNR